MFSFGQRGALTIVSNGNFVTGTTFASYLADLKGTNKIKVFFFSGMTGSDSIDGVVRGLCIAVGAYGYDGGAVFCIASDGSTIKTKAIYPS